MNEAMTFEKYLNEKKPSANTIVTAAKYVASKWANYRSTEDLRNELADKTSDKSALMTALARLEANPELLERAALAVLSLAWESEQNRALAIDAFEEAQVELLTTKATAIAVSAILVFGLWTWKSDGGETYRHTTVTRDSKGNFRTEETIVRQPFPLDPVGIVHELSSPQDSPVSAGDAPLHLTKNQIKQAQTALADAGFKISVDGIEGPRTDAVVKKFQRDNHLPVTGKLDRRTLKQLGVMESRD